MFYQYKVTYWDPYDTDEKTARGLVYAKDYGKAANKLVKSYDPTCIIDIYLYETEAEIVISKDEIDDIFSRDE